MENSKLCTNQWYSARSIDGSYGMMINETDSLRKTKEQMDDAEKRAVEQGYAPNKWLIVLNRSNTIYKTDWNGDNKRFHYRSTTEGAIGIYENGVITFFDGREPMK